MKGDVNGFRERVFIVTQSMLLRERMLRGVSTVDFCLILFSLIFLRDGEIVVTVVGLMKFTWAVQKRPILDGHSPGSFWVQQVHRSP